MDYDYFLSHYGFPGFFSGLVSAAIFAGSAFLISYLYKEKEVPTWIFVVLGSGFLISCGIMLVLGFLLPWGSPI